MAIPESQFQIWSNQGATTASQNTYNSISKALDAYTWPAGVQYDVYLQGSYKNYTNIRNDSDVDVVVELKSTFHYDLSTLSFSQKSWFEQDYPGQATYGWIEFRADVIAALQNYYGADCVDTTKKKCVRVKARENSGRLDADVIVCLTHRKYNNYPVVSESDLVEGIRFLVIQEYRWVINYPNVHFRNGARKNSRVNQLYKPTARVFKNAAKYMRGRNQIADDLAPSYFIECLAYNLPDGQFCPTYGDTYLNLLTWFVDTNWDALVCQNEQVKLFGDTPEQWDWQKALGLVRAYIELYKNW